MILEKTEDMCSVAFSGQHRQQVSVPAGSSKLISYTIIPLKTGELPLQVTAVAASFMGQDAVRKNLRVVVSEHLKPALSLVSCIILETCYIRYVAWYMLCVFLNVGPITV